MPEIKIAVDAMGSDQAPAVEVEGAVQAAAEYGIPIVLVGQEHRVHDQLRKHDTANLPIEVVHAGEVITMEESAATAARKKKDSSIRVAARLMRDAYCVAVFSEEREDKQLALYALMVTDVLKKGTEMLVAGDAAAVARSLGVEQKNGTIVRQLVGYDRFEGVAAWRRMTDLYQQLRLYINFLQPSMKLLSKKRDGAKVSRNTMPPRLRTDGFSPRLFFPKQPRSAWRVSPRRSIR